MSASTVMLASPVVSRALVWILAVGIGGCIAPSAESESSSESSVGSSSGSETDTGTDEAGESTDDEAGFLPESDMSSPDLGPPDSHAEDMQPIWTSNCVNYCHAVGMEPPAADLDLFDGAYGNIVDQPSAQVPMMMLVAPGEPDASYLWHKLVGTHLDVGGEGDLMPATGVSLDDDTLLRVETWILAGAPP